MAAGRSKLMVAWRKCPVLFLTVIAVGGEVMAQTTRETPPDASKALSQYEASGASLDTIAVVAEITDRMSGDVAPGAPRGRSMTFRFCRDHNRIGLDMAGVRLDQAGHRIPGGEQTGQAIFDGHGLIYDRTESGRIRSAMIVSNEMSFRSMVTSTLREFRLFYGYAPGVSGFTIAEVFRQARELGLRPAMEDIDGHPTQGKRKRDMVQSATDASKQEVHLC